MYDVDGELAIERALRGAHPTATLERLPLPEGGPTELAGCLATRLELPVPHWLLVSRGFTELGDKVEEDPELSGWGFELTCRLPVRGDDLDLAPVARWMHSVGRYLADKITFLEPFQHIPVVDPSEDETVRGLIVVEDPELAPTQSRNGAFAFFQLVVLTADEYEAVADWDTQALVALLHERDPLLLGDSKRTSLLRDPDFALAVEEGRQRDGSSIAIRYGVPLLWVQDHRDIDIHLSVEAVPIVDAALRSRLAYGNPMALFGDRRKVIRPDGSIALRSQVNVILRLEDGISSVEDEDGTRSAVIRFGERALRELAGVLAEEPGTYSVPALPRVRFIVASRERFAEPSYPG